MCGRYENAADTEELQEEFLKHIGNLDIAYDLDEVLKEENIAPTNRIRVIVLEDNVFKLKVMKWGIRSKIFDPSRQAAGKDPFIEKDIFNSKIETIKKAPKWKKLIKEKRCIIPMTAFYEWTGEKGSKVPQRISIQRNKIFLSGGIYTEDIKKDTSTSIITCEPNKFMKAVHNRMPVLFKMKDAGKFLEAKDDAAVEMCEPLDDEVKMKMEKAKI
jgi:putative SOS response-associated peptidase YedK